MDIMGIIVLIFVIAILFCCCGLCFGSKDKGAIFSTPVVITSQTHQAPDGTVVQSIPGGYTQMSSSPYQQGSTTFPAGGAPYPTTTPYPVTTGAPYPTGGSPYPTGGSAYPPAAGNNPPYPQAAGMPMPQMYPPSNAPYPGSNAPYPTNPSPYPPAPASNPSAPYPIDRNMDPPPYNQVVFPNQPAPTQQNYEKQAPYNPNF